MATRDCQVSVSTPAAAGGDLVTQKAIACAITTMYTLLVSIVSFQSEWCRIDGLSLNT